ncbi:MAG: GNAT family N-acetyltransferase [Rhodobacteraceae bacterium]|nr:GNAT family N-acetyltransferase [Paracoccaceae bacterium]
MNRVILSPTPILTTQRLVLRAPCAIDWPAFRDFTRDDRSRFVRPGALTDAQAWRAFGHVIGHWVMRGFGMFAVTERGQDTAIGMAGPWFPEGWPEAEIGWSIWTAGAEGRGYAFEAASATRDWVRASLGWTRIVSYIDPENSRSEALARRLGCTVDPDAAYPGTSALHVWRHPEGGLA